MTMRDFTICNKSYNINLLQLIKNLPLNSEIVYDCLQGLKNLALSNRNIILLCKTFEIVVS
jgi:hypothetical protein